MDRKAIEREAAIRDLAMHLRHMRLWQLGKPGTMTIAEADDVFREAARLSLLPTEEFEREIRCLRLAR